MAAVKSKNDGAPCAPVDPDDETIAAPLADIEKIPPDWMERIINNPLPVMATRRKLDQLGIRTVASSERDAWKGNGLFPFYKIGPRHGGLILYDLREVLRIIKSHRVAGGDTA